MNIFIGLFEHQQYSSLISFLGFHLLWVFSGKIDVMIIETPTRRERKMQNFELKSYISPILLPFLPWHLVTFNRGL